MKKILLPLLAVSALTLPAAARTHQTWTFVSSAAQLTEQDDYIMAYSFPKGVYKVKCDVMSNRLADPNRGFFAIADCDMSDDKSVISNVPADAAILRIEKIDSYYAIKMVNVENPGYLDNMGTKNGIQLSETPHKTTISFGKGSGDDSLVGASFSTSIKLTAETDNDRNEFSWVNTAVGGKMQHVFWFCAQAESGGQLGLFKRDAMNPNLVWQALPADESTQSSLNEFTITFPEATKIELAKTLSEGDYTATIDGETVAIPKLSCEGNSIKGVYSTPLSGDGLFTLSLNPDLFTLTLKDGSTVSSPVIMYDLTMFTPAPEQIYTLSPEAGAYASYPAVTLTYSGATAITPAQDAKASLTIETPDASKSFTYDFAIAAEDNTVTLTPAEEIKTLPALDAVYSLSIPENALTISYGNKEYPSEAVVILQYCVALPEYSLTSSPAAGTTVSADDLKEIKLTLSGMQLASVKADAKATLSPDAATPDDKGVSFSLTADGNSIKATTDADLSSLTSGKYILSLPKESFNISNEWGLDIAADKEFNFDFDLDNPNSIGSLDADFDSCDVYTITGIRILTQADKTALGNLPAGIYILRAAGKSVKMIVK